jgi:molybdopterin synthase catalytic subunit
VALAELTDRPLDVAAALAAVAGPRRGATVVFVGTVRDRHEGRAVSGIDYSAYERMAVAALGRIVAELEAGDDGLALAVVHRIGSLAVGEASLVIAAAAPRRDAAFAAARRTLERVKREVPVWKLERYADGTRRWRTEEALPAPE